jgi:hypothetical protein
MVHRITLIPGDGVDPRIVCPHEITLQIISAFLPQ